MSDLLVDLGIPTYRRPDLLTSLLASIARMEAEPGCRIRVMIVDNDPNGTAQHAAADAAANFGLDLQYILEPERGISQARNQILRNMRGDYLAFLDDDEVVSSSWLNEMIITLANNQADVVFGPVHRLFPAKTPQWAKIHPCFNPPQRPTGQRVETGGCGNVLIATNVLTERKLRFDPAFSLTGGEDTDFFYRLGREGARMTWCAEAVVMEHVPPDRLTLEWVMKRAYRSGQCHSRVYKRDRGGFSWARRVIRKLAQVAIALPHFAFVAPFSPARAVIALTKCAGAVGELTVLLSLGSPYEEYDPSKYRADGADRS